MSWKSWHKKALMKRVNNAIANGLLNGGEAIKSEVLQEIPHDEGTLSGSVVVLQNPNNKLEACLSAGGGLGTGMPKIPYALKWHETPANFQKGRKHNYVRDPYKRAKSGKTVERAVSQELSKVL